MLHLCGREVREGLAADLTAAGFAYRPAVVYEAVAAAGLAPTTAAAIRERRLDAVLLYSPRSAALFAALVRAAGLDRELADVVAACLSEAVAAELAGLHVRAPSASPRHATKRPSCVALKGEGEDDTRSWLRAESG